MEFTKEELFTIESHFDHAAEKHISATPAILHHFGGVVGEATKKKLIDDLVDAYTIMRTISAKCREMRK